MGTATFSLLHVDVLVVERHKVTGQATILSGVRLVKDKIDEVEAREQRGRELDVVDDGDLRVPFGL
jgi:hypothetical protein